MEDSTIYTIYFEKTAGPFGDTEEAVIEISRPGNKTSIESKSADRQLEFLAQEFVQCGWRISKKDKIQTVSPVIINKWSPKPWDENSGIGELIDKGEMIIYRGLSSEELDRFYKSYLIEVDRGAQK